MTRRPDAEIAATLRSIALELQEPRPLRDDILSILINDARASGSQLARIVRRRRNDVNTECKRLAADGLLVRVGHKWQRSQQ